MARLLFLPHRMPYPPDKGDKIRSYHLLQHLAARHRVTLATFIDDPADDAHRPVVSALCEAAFFARLSPRWGRIKSLAALATGEALTLHYYRNAALMAAVRAAARQQAFDAAIVFSSSMVPYAQALPGTPMLLDLVDVDSAKWAAYAPRHRWPLSWPLAREGRALLAFERNAVAQARCSFLCTEQERDLFYGLAPESRGRVDVLRNGVDAEYYAPDPARASPFTPGEQAIVFTGAMDYWPNVDAVSWFVQSMLGPLRERYPAARFHIVGRSPTPAVQALAGEAVNVTGTVPDVRPYLQHAAAVIAPLRIARGIQNKILEAMSMARPVVTARSCVAALQVQSEAQVFGAESEQDYLQCLQTLLDDPRRAAAIGEAGRRFVLETYSWAGSLGALDRRLDEVLHGAAGRLPAKPPAAAANAPAALPSAGPLEKVAKGT